MYSIMHRASQLYISYKVRTMSYLVHTSRPNEECLQTTQSFPQSMLHSKKQAGKKKSLSSCGSKYSHTQKLLKFATMADRSRSRSPQRDEDNAHAPDENPRGDDAPHDNGAGGEGGDEVKLYLGNLNYGK